MRGRMGGEEGEAQVDESGACQCSHVQSSSSPVELTQRGCEVCEEEPLSSCNHLITLASIQTCNRPCQPPSSPSSRVLG